MSHRCLAILAALIIALAAVACDDNPGDYPCNSNIARCANPTPATQPVQIR